MKDQLDTKPDNEAMPDGKIDAFLSAWLGRSWRTSLLGVAVVVAGAVSLVPGVSPQVQDIARAIGVLAGGGGLLTAKDRQVSGKK